MWDSARRKLALGLTAALVLGGASVATSGAAQAADDRAPTIISEVIAYYQHGWDIQPDRAQVDTYFNEFSRDNCSWGLAAAGYELATSDRARNRWHNNPQDLAGMLYAMFLNRGPDDGGLTTYTNSINDRGLEWATASMLSSDEYHQRIAGICGADDVRNAAVYTHEDAWNFAQGTLMNNAVNLAIGCVFMHKIQDMAGFHKNPASNRILFIQFAGELANGWYSNAEDSCAAALTYVKAAYQIWTIVSDGDSPVFIRQDTHRSWWTFRQVEYFEMQIGPNPNKWTGYDGAVAELDV